MAMTKWGRKETIIWPPHSPIYTYGAVFMAVVLTGLFLYCRFTLRQQPTAAFLHADLHPIERCRSNRSEPQRQLPDAHGGRSRNSTASGDECRRDRTARRRNRAASPSRLRSRRPALQRGYVLLYLGPEQNYIDASLSAYLKKCGLRWRWPFRSLQAPTAFRSCYHWSSSSRFPSPRTSSGARQLRYGRRLKGPEMMTPREFNGSGPRRRHRHQNRRDEGDDPHTGAGRGTAHADHRRYRRGQDRHHAPDPSTDKSSWRFSDRLRPGTRVRPALLRPEEWRRDPESAR